MAAALWTCQVCLCLFLVPRVVGSLQRRLARAEMQDNGVAVVEMMIFDCRQTRRTKKLVRTKRLVCTKRLAGQPLQASLCVVL